jgi:hypothetical protein
MKAIEDALTSAKDTVQLSARFVSFLTLILLPLVLGVWVDKADPTTVGAFTFWAVIAVIFAIQTFVYTKLDRKASEDTPQLVFAYNDLVNAHERLTVEAAELSTSLENTIAAHILGRTWSAQQAHLGLFFETDYGSVKEACEAIIEPLLSQAGKVFGWEYDDRWTVSVYRWSSASNLLEPLWWKRANEHPSNGTPRTWRDGEGHCGTAFMSQQTLFTDDLNDQSTFNRVRPTPANVRYYDHDVYRSFVTVPLTIAHPDAPEEDVRLGVVTLTSDVMGRFGETNVGIAEQLGDVLAQALYIDHVANRKTSAYGSGDDREEGHGEAERG